MSIVPSEPVASPSEDPVPAELRSVIELFATQLAKVAFPEVDVALLRRQADDLRAEAAAVARARAALEAAQHALAARTSTLTETAARGVAYARIYAEAHPDRAELTAALAALVESRPTAPSVAPMPKRRGRPPKQSAELFAATAAEGAAG